MSSQHLQSLSEQLPEELMSNIFSNLTVVELARIQRTCKRWYNIAQQNSALWKDTIPFFSHLEKLSYPKSWCEEDKEKVIKKRSEMNLYGFHKLQQLSKHRLDSIMLSTSECLPWNDILCAAIIKALEEHPPTKLSLKHRKWDTMTSHLSHCLKVLSNNKSLKHLDLIFHGNFSQAPNWSLKLSCSLESVNLDCPSLAKCTSKESLIEAFKSAKKMKLVLLLERPENMEFLEKVGQNLEILELCEDDFNGFERAESESQLKEAEIGDRIMICLPKLIELAIRNSSEILNRSYQLNCPQLQLLDIRVELKEADGQDRNSSFELLVENESLKHLFFCLYGDIVFDSWSLELSCSLESLDLESPSLSKCRSKESLIEAFKSVKKMELDLPLERPGSLEFLGKVGLNLEELYLHEELWERQTKLKEKTVICLPKLRKLTVDSDSDISNVSFRLDCPQLQSLQISGDLKKSLQDGPGTSLYEILVTTASLTHVSISSDDIYSMKKFDHEKIIDFEVCLQRLFSKFRYIKELTFKTRQHVTLKCLVDILPESVQKLVVEYKYIRRSDLHLSENFSQIHLNGANTRNAKEDNSLICELNMRGDLVSLVDPTFINSNITIHGREKLRAFLAIDSKK